MTEMTDRDNSSAETDAETTSAESVDSPTTGDATAADDFTEVDSSDDDTVVLKKDAASSTSRTPQGKRASACVAPRPGHRTAMTPTVPTTTP